jgi:sugar lactone lactonase YvrE
MIRDDAVPRVNKCKPKLVIFDLDTGKKTYTFEFPEAVASSEKNFITSLALDPKRQVAYISNMPENSLIVLNRMKNSAKKYTHGSMQHFPYAKQISNGDGKPRVAENGIFGVALSPDFKTLFYSAYNGYQLYSIETAALNDESTPEQLPDTLVKPAFNKTVQTVGEVAPGGLKFGFNKTVQSLGLTIGQKYLYFTSLPTNEIWRVELTRVFDPEVQAELVAFHRNMRWPTTLQIDENGFLWISTSRANRFVLKELEFKEGGEMNYGVWRINVGEKSYLHSDEKGLESAPQPAANNNKPVISEQKDEEPGNGGNPYG